MWRFNRKRWKRQLYSSLRFCGYVITRFLADGCFYRASALTFTTLLAIVPLMFVTFSILSVFPVFNQFGNDIRDFIFANFVPAAGEVVKSYLLGFVQKAGALSWFGIVFLVVTAILMLYTIEQAFNHIWRVQRRRRGISTFMLYWSILTLSPLLLGASFALSTYVLSFPEVTSAAAWLGWTETLIHVATFVLVWLVFTILYITIPNCQVPVQHGFIGGLISALLYEIVRQGFIFYITHFSTYQVIYGALASIPVFLIWVYLLWLIILFGAVLTQCLTFRFTIIGRRKLQPFMHAIQWLGYLWQAQQQGKVLSLLELVRKDRCQYVISPEQQIDILQNLNYVIRVKNGTYVLGVDLNNVSLLQLYESLPWKLPSAGEDFRECFWVDSFGTVLKQLNNNISNQMDVSVPQLIR